MLVLAVLVVLSNSAGGQVPLTDAGIVAQMRQRPQERPEARACANKPAYILGNTAGGAFSGWLVFMATLGIFASDHGAEYKRMRRTFVLSGAMLGASKGVWDATTIDCIPRHPRGRER